MKYRRAQKEGGTYFFTVVTDKRRPFLCESENIPLLRTSFAEIKSKHPFVIDAIVILPDHIHCLWTLPLEDSDYSMRWRQIKSAFSRRCSSQYKGEMTQSQIKKKEQAIWQRRFWEHEIQNELDYKKHVEYIHYNPVKHGLVDAPIDWEYSSFKRYVDRGVYLAGWGAGEEIRFEDSIGRE